MGEISQEVALQFGLKDDFIHLLGVVANALESILTARIMGKVVNFRSKTETNLPPYGEALLFQIFFNVWFHYLIYYHIPDVFHHNL